MAITLQGIALPNGLRWSDEFTWAPLKTTVNYSLTGALILQTAERLAGRPITLIGGERWAWITRANLLTLQTLLNTYAASLTLILHDSRAFSVVPDYSETGPLDATPKAIVEDSGLANPGTSAWYVINTIRLITV